MHYRAALYGGSELAIVAVPFIPTFQKIQASATALPATQTLFLPSYFHVHTAGMFIRKTLVKLVYSHIFNFDYKSIY